MKFEIPDALPVLAKGNHSPGSGKACIMDAISIISGHPEEQDHPSCVHPMLRQLFVLVNDYVTDETRPKLWPLGLRAMGTANPTDITIGDVHGRDVHTAVTILMTLARDILVRAGAAADTDDHPGGMYVPVLVGWLKSPAYKYRHQARIYLNRVLPDPGVSHFEHCHACMHLRAGLGTILYGAGIQEVRLPSVDNQLRACSDAEKIEVLTRVMDAFERSRPKEPQPAVSTVIDWDKLRSDLGIVSAAKA